MKLNKELFFKVFALLIVIIILGFLVFNNFKLNQKRQNFNALLNQLKAQIRELEEKKQSLEAEINQSQQEDYLEKKAREDLNLRKWGEQVVAFPVMEEIEKLVEPDQEEQSLWQRFLDRFGISN